MNHMDGTSAEWLFLFIAALGYVCWVLRLPPDETREQYREHDFPPINVHRHYVERTHELFPRKPDENTSTSVQTHGRLPLGKKVTNEPVKQEVVVGDSPETCSDCIAGTCVVPEGNIGSSSSGEVEIEGDAARNRKLDGKIRGFS